jgi:hypothetical protein
VGKFGQFWPPKTKEGTKDFLRLQVADLKVKADVDMTLVPMGTKVIPK